jgi:hypothetical protein
VLIVHSERSIDSTVTTALLAIIDMATHTFMVAVIIRYRSPRLASF